MPEPRTCPECDTALPSDSPGGLCVVCGLREALETSDDFDSAIPDSSVERTEPSIKIEPSNAKPGDKIGRYKLLQEIGVGGICAVWMAEQEEPVRRRVALKMVKWGMDAEQVAARFETERQALALMDHPNIAKVLDAGTTGTTDADSTQSQISNLKSQIPKSRPFFVTELVRGIPITAYCERRALSSRERLELFTQVCQAVQHAHQKGVIHRNIKPSNILVTHQDGASVPKVLDFGVANATADQPLNDGTLFTAVEQFTGTPAYMSPEQAMIGGLDIDTRSDIYGLGVLLYELLTGQPPFRGKELPASGLEAMREIILEKQPPRPSTRLGPETRHADEAAVSESKIKSPPFVPKGGTSGGRQKSKIPPDLDCIVMKCLEKDRSRRYETANALAMDIQRHLDNEPVTASAPSDLDRFQKLVRRNKLAFSLASAVAISLIIGLIVLATLFLREKESGRTQEKLRQESEAARQRQTP